MGLWDAVKNQVKENYNKQKDELEQKQARKKFKP